VASRFTLVERSGFESHRSLPKTRPTARVFVVPGSRISLEVSALLLPAIWSAHYFNYLDQIAGNSDQPDRTLHIREPSEGVLPILISSRGTP